MPGPKSTAAEHDCLGFADTVPGRLQAELHYLRQYTLRDAIDAQLTPLVIDTPLIQSAERHGSTLAQERIRVNPQIEPTDAEAIEQRSKVFLRGAVLAATVEIPRDSQSVSAQLMRAYVPPPFPFVPRGELVSARAIEQYELESHHAFSQLLQSDRDAISAVAIRATEHAPAHYRVVDQDEFLFGYVAARNAIAMKLASLEKRRG